MRRITLLLVLILLGCKDQKIQPVPAPMPTVKAIAVPRPMALWTEASQMIALQAFITKKLGKVDSVSLHYSSPVCCGVEVLEEAKIRPEVTEYLIEDEGWSEDGFGGLVKSYQTTDPDRKDWYYRLSDDPFHGKSIILGKTTPWIKTPEGTWTRTVCYVSEIKRKDYLNLNPYKGARIASSGRVLGKDGLTETRRF